jgi:hypothetical protein
MSEINKLTLKTLKIFNRIIPSFDSMKQVLDTFDDKKSALEFYKWNSHIIQQLDFKYNPELYINSSCGKEKEKLELQIQSINIMKTKANIIGLRNFSDILTSHAVVDWFDLIFGNFRGGDPQRIVRDMSMYKLMEKEFLMTGELPPLPRKIKQIEEYPHTPRACEYVEYLQALNLISSFAWRCSYSSRYNLELRRLITIDQLNIVLKIASLASTEKNIYSFWCPICGKFTTVLQGKKLATCGKGECLTKYKEHWDSINRPSKGRDPIGWKVAFNGTPQLCKGEKCLLDLPGKRQVNERYFCRNCFTEHFQGKGSDPVE